MTAAILGWQALIFFSIGLAGGRRGWVIAFWIAWTVVQVATLPLSVIQFGTIWLAWAVFRPRAAAPVLAVPMPAPEPLRTVEVPRVSVAQLYEDARRARARRRRNLIGLGITGLLAGYCFLRLDAEVPSDLWLYGLIASLVLVFVFAYRAER